MTRRKPSCTDFIIAAARKIRYKPTNLKTGTAAGVGLHKVYQLAMEVYSDKEFRDSLTALMEKGDVVVMARAVQVTRNGEGTDYGCSRDEMVSVFHADVPLNQQRLNLDEEGHPTDGEKHKLLLSIRLYVKADGLPQKVLKVLSPPVRHGVRITAEEIIAAAKRAHAWKFIERLPEGLNTLVGERGIKLSGGERQRIALARAFLADAQILVFDEPTSALDTKTELEIEAATVDLRKGRTCIVIAHRLSTIARADRIIVMEKGSIIEEGTHEHLLDQNGVYADL